MRKEAYLSAPVVRDFIAWMEPILDTPHSFTHSYSMKKPKKNYAFDSLYTAYKKYDWRSPAGAFAIHADNLKKSLITSDEHACKNACYGILKWGGVLRGNEAEISNHPDLCAYLLEVKNRLGSDLPLDEYFFAGLHMNSGFSKIYSAYIEDFIIYDGRVGASFGLLVRMFCTERGLSCVPDELNFAWAPGQEAKYVQRKSNRRNPSCDMYKFPALDNNKPEKHLENNIRANWLLSELVRTTKSKFANEPFPMRALEQALFMIGYDVSNAAENSGEKNKEHAMTITSFPDKASAKKTAKLLIEQRLAACVQMFPIESVYLWEGEVCEGDEVALLIKSRAALFDQLVVTIRENHPYEVPEIIQIPMTAGLPAYLRWIDDCTYDKEGEPK
ncbi:MAG: divalent-cation tolerance protein CutA [Oscillospiraceae bacterium]|nr:divalent-cation tolerance protein CutA [Oscillospiraceae bacterium]